MKKLLLLTCIGLTMGTVAYGEVRRSAYIEDESQMIEMKNMESPTGTATSRWTGEFNIWQETDKVRSSDNDGGVTDVGTSIKMTDNETGMFYMYRLLTTSLTKDASERDRHNFRA